MATKATVVVTYDDGRVETFNPNRPRLLLDMEQRWNVQNPERHEQVMWLAYHALVTLAGKEDVDYTDWIDSIEDIDTVTEDDGKDGKQGGGPRSLTA